METQKITKDVNLLKCSDNENSKFATKKCYIIDSESKGNYSHENPIKFLTKSIEPSLCDYSDSYILFRGDIAVKKRNNNDTNDIDITQATQVVFKNCGPFKDCRTEINDTFADYSNFINITISMYNLIEYSDNYSDTSRSLWNFKTDEIINNADVTNDNNVPSFKYKANLIGNTGNNGRKNGLKIVVPLKYLSNFWRSLEMPLINCKIELSLMWIENYLLTINPNANNNINKATLTITDEKRYVPIVTLKTEDNAKLSKLLREGFKRSIYWNKYQVIPNKIINITINGGEHHLRELLDSNYQGVKRLFVVAYNNSADNDGKVFVNSFKKYFLPRVKIENYNIEIDGGSFYDQPINDSIKQYDEIRKISSGEVDDYTTGCLLDFFFFKYID